MTTQSDTPVTDSNIWVPDFVVCHAMVNAPVGTDDPAAYVPASVCAKLERERNELLVLMKDFVSVGCEFYDMDMGENGSQLINRAHDLLEKLERKDQSNE